MNLVRYGEPDRQFHERIQSPEVGDDVVVYRNRDLSDGLQARNNDLTDFGNTRDF